MFYKQSIRSNQKANLGWDEWTRLILQHTKMGYPQSFQRPNVTFLDFRNIYVMDFCEVLHLFCGFAKIRFQSDWLGWEVPWKLRSDFQPSGKIWWICIDFGYQSPECHLKLGGYCGKLTSESRIERVFYNRYYRSEMLSSVLKSVCMYFWLFYERATQ